MDALYREVILLMLEIECCSGAIFSQVKQKSDDLYARARHARFQNPVQAIDVQYITNLKDVSYRVLSGMFDRLEEIACYFFEYVMQAVSLETILAFQDNPVSDYGLRQVFSEHQQKTIHLNGDLVHYVNSPTEQDAFIILSQLQWVARNRADTVVKHYDFLMFGTSEVKSAAEVSRINNDFFKASYPILNDFIAFGRGQLEQLQCMLQRFNTILTYQVNIFAKQQEFFLLSSQLLSRVEKSREEEHSALSITSSPVEIKKESPDAIKSALSLSGNETKLRPLLPRQAG